MPSEFIRTQTHDRPRRAWALGLLAAALLLTGCESQADKTNKAANAAYREKLAKAKAIFAERCKTAGVVIHRTVKDVEGIAIDKVRPKLDYADKRYFDPMWPEAAMATEARGDDYIKQFMLSEISPHVREPSRRGDLFTPNADVSGDTPPRHLMRGYRFVDFSDSSDGLRYRFTLPAHPSARAGQTPLKREPLKAAPARYLLDFEDLVDPVDRIYWVAGTKLRVIDQKNGEVLAELTRFVIEPGFGSDVTGRWPWQIPNGSYSMHCPKLNIPPSPYARYFVDTVLIPKQGD